jgi:hypothetical protein
MAMHVSGDGIDGWVLAPNRVSVRLERVAQAAAISSHDADDDAPCAAALTKSLDQRFVQLAAGRLSGDGRCGGDQRENGCGKNDVQDAVSHGARRLSNILTNRTQTCENPT